MPKYRFPEPQGSVTRAEEPIPVVVAFRPIPVLDPVDIESLAVAWGQDSVIGAIVLVWFDGDRTREHWVPAGDVTRR